MANALEPVAFCADLLPVVHGFSCGSEPWTNEPARWIQEHSLEAMMNGTKVWLYMNQDGFCVGFSSLAVTRWRFPTKKSSPVDVIVIPEVAIRTEFQGEPKEDRSADPQIDGRYSAQIMRHLLDAAFQWPGSMPAVGLFVDPRNAPAIKLYERFGFAKFDPPYLDKVTGIAYDRYAIRRA